jgi:hypothetical protein
MPLNDPEMTEQNASEPQIDSGVLEDMLSLWDELQGLGHDHFRLAALETRRAGQSLVTMLATSVLMVLLLNSAWLGLLAGGVVWLLENGIKASSALMLTVALNLLLLLICIRVIRRHSRYLQFPALTNGLNPNPVNPWDKDKR